jgi:cell wall-associated NlpC family hydrolase
MNNPKELLIYATNLLPGDILLFRSIDQKRHQRKISAVTGSPYTHAAIYLGNGDLAPWN